MNNCLYFVVPCYNDENTLPLSVPVFLKKLNTLMSQNTVSENSKLLLVNDGSADNTWNTILSLKEQYANIIALNLDRNVGEQNALIAGMSVAVNKADCIITMDSDLQDDIDAVDKMLCCFEQGDEIAYGVRIYRKEDGFLERFNSTLFYFLMRLGKTGLIKQHANYRLMSKKAAEYLIQNYKPHFYLPCFVSNMPFKGQVVYHKRFQRVAGETGYSFKKKIHLALQSLLVHSDLLIRCCAVLTAVFSVLFLGGFIWLVVKAASQGAFSVGVCICDFVLLLCAGLFGTLLRRLKNTKASFDTAHTNSIYQIKEMVS